MNSFPFLSTGQFLRGLRILLGLMLASHGLMRIFAGTVGGFGEFLAGNGFPLGIAFAWGVTVFEILGGLTLAIGFATRWIPLVFIIELITGIVLVHAPRGWFTVGYTLGGAEFSVLLICCFLLVASTAEHRRTLKNTEEH